MERLYEFRKKLNILPAQNACRKRKPKFQSWQTFASSQAIRCTHITITPPPLANEKMYFFLHMLDLSISLFLGGTDSAAAKCCCIRVFILCARKYSIQPRQDYLAKSLHTKLGRAEVHCCKKGSIVTTGAVPKDLKVL